ncbi:hypothetical protein BDF20DRAFT_833290 [Mycotypha africana]|uniref:uncharacterized protein n=1 Tax=Mycotypha africana TaxID=64632 RepID=UPI0023001BFB|nr:uncharacterized protein BDF20DRAFT_833290 [Mycotypha africana]KAI8988435.1 hypothetical protein BDF20DRAFT_833290 [Mycotypha africana]
MVGQICLRTLISPALPHRKDTIWILSSHQNFSLLMFINVTTFFFASLAWAFFPTFIPSIPLRPVKHDCLSNRHAGKKTHGNTCESRVRSARSTLKHVSNRFDLPLFFSLKEQPISKRSSFKAIASFKVKESF